MKRDLFPVGFCVTIRFMAKRVRQKEVCMRLDKYLADMGVGTRSEVKSLIRKGVVTIGGQVCKRAEEQVKENDLVRVEGKSVVYVTQEYYMLYKPAGVLSATRDRNEKTVVDLIVSKKRKDLFPVGRLDKDTEGLLLITNDGELAHRLLSPKKHVGKVYFAVLDGKITKEQVKRLEEGIELETGVITLPASLCVLTANHEKSEVEITIYEGKFHQVKRMFEAIGLTVTYLKRLAMGTLVLDPTLKKGEYRALTKEEREQLQLISDREPLV